MIEPNGQDVLLDLRMIEALTSVYEYVVFDTPPKVNDQIRVLLQASTYILVLTSLTKPLYPAGSVPITFRFAKAGSVTVTVPVQLSTLPSGSGLTVPPGTATE